MTTRANLKILYTANELSNNDSSPTFAAQENRMGQVDGVTRPRLAPNEYPLEIATIVSDRPSGEVLSHTSANGDVAVQRAEELGSSAPASSDKAAQQASDFQGRLGQVVRTHHTLAAQLNQAMQALDRAEQNSAAAATTSAQHFAQQHAALAAAKAEAATLRESLEWQLATVYVRAVDAEAAAERLSRREAELAEAVESNQILQRRFSDAVILLQEQDADREATTKRITQREAELAEATQKRLSLESELVEAQRALGEAVRRSVDDRSTAIQEAAHRQSKFDALLREEVAKYDTLAKDLLATREALVHADTMFQEAEARHALATTTAAEQLSQQEAKLREGTAAREILEGQLASAHTALRAGEERAAAERLAARELAAERDAEFTARLHQEATTREMLEQALTAASNNVAEAESAIRDAEHRHASQMTTVTARLADQQIQYETRLAEAAAARDLVDQRLREVEVSLEQSRKEAAVDAAAVSERLAQEAAKVREGTAGRLMLEGQLADAYAARQAAETRVAAERLAATQRAAERDAEFVARIHQEAGARETLEQALTAARNKVSETETAIRDAEQRHDSQMTTVTARFADEQVRYETRLSEAATARDLVDQRLREVEASFERSRQEATAHAATAAERLAQLETQRVEALANLQTLEGQLVDANAALHAIEESVATERLTAERQAAQRQAEFAAAISLETAGRRATMQDLATSQRKVAESESALRNAEQRHASAMTLALAQFAERQTELETRLSHAASSHAALEQALSDAEQRHVSETKTAAAQSAERQREFETLLAQRTAVRDASEVRLRETEATLVRIHDERAAEAVAVAEQRTQLESELATATAHGETLDRRLAEITSALHTAEQLVVSDRVASAERATERQKEFDARLSLELGTRNTIEQALAATRQNLQQTEAGLREALAQHAREMTTASNELSAQRRQHTMQLTQALVEHAAVEQKFADAEQRHASALKAAATQLTEQQSQYETRLAEVMTAREILSQQLHETETTLARIRQESDANAIAYAERLSQREFQLAAASAARQVLEGRLADRQTALKNTEAQALADRTSLQQQLAQRQAEFDAQLAREIEACNREIDARKIIERDLAEHRVAAEQTRQRLLDQSATLTTEMRELEVRLTQELAREVADYEDKLEDLQTQLGALNVERDGLRECLATSRAQLETLSRLHEDAKENFERIRQAKEIELQRLADDLAVVRQTLDQVRADAVQTLQRVGSEHAAELALIKALVAERDRHLSDQAADHRQQVEQLQSDLKAVTQNFEQTRRHRDRLQIESDRVPPLTKRLEASREESQRQFDGSPIGILRCSEAGELKDANRALISALGYRTVDELRALGSAASVFESPDDFRWFIETCETPSESVDWIWKKKDDSRLMMRLRALRLSADVVDIVAEDVTTLRGVEERLRRAQRMEAVGRLASEVADTCDILLRNVSQDTRKWLAIVGSNTAQRHQGELILSDVTRAAGFLRQLSAFGKKQTSALAGVELNTMLRDLAPVLKRVAGDDIQLVLPKKVVALNVDVDAERVERVLVNIVAYGRARMPLSGQLIIELGRVVVDRDFVTKYQNVRQGAHALISVKTVSTAAPVERPTGIRESLEATAIGATCERPGVDIGVVQALIDDCGGHLWMNAEPGGDMELKIHLPLRSADASRIAGVVRSALGRSVSSWLQS